MKRIDVGRGVQRDDVTGYEELSGGMFRIPPIDVNVPADNMYQIGAHLDLSIVNARANDDGVIDRHHVHIDMKDKRRGPVVSLVDPVDVQVPEEKETKTGETRKMGKITITRDVDAVQEVEEQALPAPEKVAYVHLKANGNTIEIPDIPEISIDRYNTGASPQQGPIIVVQSTSEGDMKEIPRVRHKMIIVGVAGSILVETYVDIVTCFTAKDVQCLITKVSPQPIGG